MNAWPQHLEEEVELSGVNCGTSSPQMTVRIVPDSNFLQYMREVRLFTIKNPGLSSVPPSWVWNIVPKEEVNADQEKKGKKEKDKKGGNTDLSFPYPNTQFIMGIYFYIHIKCCDRSCNRNCDRNSSYHLYHLYHLHNNVSRWKSQSRNTA